MEASHRSHYAQHTEQSRWLDESCENNRNHIGGSTQLLVISAVHLLVLDTIFLIGEGPPLSWILQVSFFKRPLDLFIRLILLSGTGTLLFESLKSYNGGLHETQVERRPNQLATLCPVQLWPS